jgi:hypothetical protein
VEVCHAASIGPFGRLTTLLVCPYLHAPPFLAIVVLDSAQFCEMPPLHPRLSHYKRKTKQYVPSR